MRKDTKGMNLDAQSSSTSADDEMEMIWIYSTGNFAEAEILTDVFTAEDIAYMARKKELPAFPTTVGEHGQILIAVEDHRVAEARGLIQQAIVDEAIPGDGNFLES